MDIVPKLQKLWNSLELRVLVLLSLLLQVILIATGNRRRYSTKKRVAAVLWLAYLSADSVATLALGVLSQAGGDAKNASDPKYTITALWAPFLLMHLGGPDTITAYALADNELWSRHFLGLLGQVFVAVYVFFRSFSGAHLNFLWLVIFFAGVVKYGERTWVLFSASKDRFRDSMVSLPDPGPDYAKFMDAMVLQKAYRFFGTFKKLFADLILSFQDRETSVSYFEKLHWDDAFSIVEIELGLVFDLLYTKSPLIFTKTGFFLRLFSCSSAIAAFVAFLIIEKRDYPETEVIITYILLAGAIFLEIYAVVLLFLSDRTMIWLNGNLTTRPEEKLPKLVSILYCLHLVPARKRWSNSMGQYNVFEHCLKYMPKKKKRSEEHWYCDQLLVNFHQYLHKYFFWRSEPVEETLKDLIFEELKRRNDEGDRKKVDSNWSDKILKETNCFDENDEVEFDQSLLLWHMATDLCYHTKVDENIEVEDDVKSKRESCRLLSNYMVHLLIVSPFMLPSGIGQIRFQDTCAEATGFLNHEKTLSEEKICEMLSRVDTRFVPSEVKGDRSKSLLFDARRLAAHLEKVEVNERWEKVTRAWLDMLTFAAAHCSWSDHAEKLSQGGELLTHVWLLMAHFGMTDQFQISKGYNRVKLELK
ncbi:hypothetical protein C2S53_012264 [Perilla frutescens var. hirtella]|uniref:DUF4220 domain-containing protein n=1 Tax=Perilla frutescens var. hirtella TaxID=608512 RepID=A0AAD4J343_PERFH|nr:hypothetical protein C2S53_012264 [Perilla frutescens var. hirtella]